MDSVRALVTSAAGIDALIHQTPAPIADIRRDVPAPLAQIVQRCLEKDRAKRYASAVELSTELRSLAPHTASAATAARRYLVIAGAVAILAIAAVGWVALRRSQAAAFV